MTQSLSTFLEHSAAKVSKGRVAFTVEYQGDRVASISAQIVGFWGITPESVERDRNAYRKALRQSAFPDHPYMEYDRVEFWERGFLAETILKQPS